MKQAFSTSGSDVINKFVSEILMGGSPGEPPVEKYCEKYGQHYKVVIIIKQFLHLDVFGHCSTYQP